MAKVIPVTTINGLFSLAEVESVVNSGDTDYVAEISAADDRSFFMVDNVNGAGEVSVSLTAGDYGVNTDKEIGTVEPGKCAVFCLDSRACKTAEGICLKVSPADMGAKLSALQFLPVINH